MKYLFNLLLLISIVSYGQTIKPSNKLIIDHGDVKLYLDDDTSSMISKHSFKYSNFKKLKSNSRCDCWFVDQYSKLKITNYNKAYNKSGYDFGHLTPSHITTYDTSINKYSFSLFNQAPQNSDFNRYIWEKLEERVEIIIDSLKTNSVIITGVIYNNKNMARDYKKHTCIIKYLYLSLQSIRKLNFCSSLLVEQNIMLRTQA